MMESERWIVNEPVFEPDFLNGNLKTEAWAGHRSFAYDLTLFLKPKIMVELGTHHGCSFFAFCQAVKDFGLKTACVAIDHWQGDEHAGFYGAEVFDQVRRIVSECYTDVDIELKRMGFDQAAKEFDDDSINLLHIDGLHTYEAVRHDFETWLPKLKENAVVLFHDVAEYTGFGSPVFWRELKAKYKAFFEFPHSYGLGVLFPLGKKHHEAMLENNFAGKLRLYEYKGKNDVNEAELVFHKEALNQQQKAIKDMSRFIDRQKDKIMAQEKEIGRQEHFIEWQRKVMGEQKQTISRLGGHTPSSKK